jgi:antibiotic biosynthesis monooxygenase (ABM) superfamily enzyme
MGAPVDTQPPRPPNQHKLVLLTWVGIYPTITLVLWLLLPTLLEHFALPVITLIVTAIVVPLMSYVVMPTLLKLFGEWTRR